MDSGCFKLNRWEHRLRCTAHSGAVTSLLDHTRLYTGSIRAGTPYRDAYPFTGADSYAYPLKFLPYLRSHTRVAAGPFAPYNLGPCLPTPFNVIRAVVPATELNLLVLLPPAMDGWLYIDSGRVCQRRFILVSATQHYVLPRLTR